MYSDEYMSIPRDLKHLVVIGHLWAFKSCISLQYQFCCIYFFQANALLQKNLENAKASLEVLIADLQFLRDQVTITQVYGPCLCLI